MIFDAERQARNAILWLKYKLSTSGINKAVIGISGGKDSYVAAALLTKAIGSENVIGISIPNGEQTDIDDAITTLKLLNLQQMQVNIGEAYQALTKQLGTLNTNAQKNIPPRLRMTVLYAAAANNGALVCGTSNASEIYVGYSTKHGDQACDISPLASFTKNEVIAVGTALGLNQELMHKAPSDGLGSGTDEEALGFTYAALDSYIRTGSTNHAFTKIADHKYRYQPTQAANDEELIKRITALHNASAHKRAMPPYFTFSLDE